MAAELVRQAVAELVREADGGETAARIGELEANFDHGSVSIQCQFPRRTVLWGQVGPFRTLGSHGCDRYHYSSHPGGGSMKAADSRRPRRIVAIAVAVVALAAGAAGAASSPPVAGSPCTTASGLPGTTVVWTDSNGVVRVWCQYAPPSEALPVLVLNEVDYDQVGTDAGGFVELYNAGLSPADLEGLALVFVDGADGNEYLRKPLRGSLAAGAYLVVSVNPQNGAPDGVALYDTRYEGVIDALSYEGAIERAFIGPFAHTLVDGNALPPSVADSNSVTGSISRIPNGSDTGDSASDWSFTRTVTPGRANVG